MLNEIEIKKTIDEYFEYIKNGTKRLEIRLNDEKRKNINIKDTIIFEKLDETKEHLTTTVTNLYKYFCSKIFGSHIPNRINTEINVVKENLFETPNSVLLLSSKVPKNKITEPAKNEIKPISE